MCFFKKRKAKKLALENSKKQEVLDEKKTEVSVDEVKEKPVENLDEKVESKKVLEKPVVKSEKLEDTKTPKYHVSQNKDTKSPHYKKWRVRLSGSQKTIKYHDTQVEAIKHAEELAEKNNTSIVIHKVDGSIRKQNYND